MANTSGYSQNPYSQAEFEVPGAISKQGVVQSVYQEATGRRENFFREPNTPYKILQGIYFALKNRRVGEDFQGPELTFSETYGILINAAKVLYNSQEGKRNLGFDLITLMERVRCSDCLGKHSSIFSNASTQCISDFFERTSSLVFDNTQKWMSEKDLATTEAALIEIADAFSSTKGEEHKNLGVYSAHRCVEDMRSLIIAYRENTEETPYAHHQRLMKGVEGIFLDHLAYLDDRRESLTQEEESLEKQFAERVKNFLLGELIGAVERNNKTHRHSASFVELSGEQFRTLLSQSINPYFSQGEHKHTDATSVLETASSIVTFAKTFFKHFIDFEATLPNELQLDTRKSISPRDLQKILDIKKNMGKAFLMKALPAISLIKFPLESTQPQKKKHDSADVRCLNAQEVLEIRDEIFTSLAELYRLDIHDDGDMCEVFLEIAIPHLRTAKDVEELKSLKKSYTDFLLQPGVRLIETFQLKNFLRKELAPYNGTSSHYITALGGFFSRHIDDIECAIEFIEKLSPSPKSFPKLDETRLTSLYMEIREALKTCAIKNEKNLQSLKDFLYKDFTTLFLETAQEIPEEVFSLCVSESLKAILKIHTNHKHRKEFLALLRSALKDSSPLEACKSLVEAVKEREGIHEERSEQGASSIESEGDAIAQILKIERDHPMITVLSGKEGGGFWWNKKLDEFTETCRKLGVSNQWYTTKASQGEPKLCLACKLDSVTFAAARLQGGKKLIEIAEVLNEEDDGHALRRVINTRIVPFVFENSLVSDRVTDARLLLLKSVLRVPAVLERLSRENLDERFISALIKKLDSLLSAHDADECLVFLIDKARAWSDKDIGSREFSTFLTSVLFVPEIDGGEPREVLHIVRQQYEALEHFFTRSESDHRNEILDFSTQLFSFLPEYSWNSIVEEINVCLESKILDISVHGHIASKFLEWKHSELDSQRGASALSLESFLQLISSIHHPIGEVKGKDIRSQVMKVLSEVLFDRYPEQSEDEVENFLCVIKKFSDEQSDFLIEYVTRILSPLSERFTSIDELTNVCDKFRENLAVLKNHGCHQTLWQLFGFQGKVLSKEDAYDALRIVDIFKSQSSNLTLELPPETYIQSGMKYLKAFRRSLQKNIQNQSASVDFESIYEAFGAILQVCPTFSPLSSKIFIIDSAVTLATLPVEEIKPLCDELVEIAGAFDKDAHYLFIKYILPALLDSSDNTAQHIRKISKDRTLQESLTSLSLALYKGQSVVSGFYGTLHEQKIEKFLKKLPKENILDGFIVLGSTFGRFFDRFKDSSFSTSDELFSKIIFPIYNASCEVRHDSGGHKKFFDSSQFTHSIQAFLDLEECIHEFKDTDPIEYSNFLLSITQTSCRVFSEAQPSLSFNALREAVSKLPREKQLDFFSVTVPLVIGRLDNDKSVQKAKGGDRAFTPQIFVRCVEGVDKFLEAYKNFPITLSEISRPVIGSLRDGASMLPLFFSVLTEIRATPVAEKILHPLTLHILFRRIPSLRTEGDLKRALQITIDFISFNRDLDVSDSLKRSPFHRKLAMVLSPGRKLKHPLYVFDAMTSLPFVPSSKFLTHVTKLFEVLENHQKSTTPFLSYFRVGDERYAESLIVGPMTAFAEKSLELSDESISQCLLALRKLSFHTPESLKESFFEHSVSKIIKLSPGDPSKLLEALDRWLSSKEEDSTFILEECFFPIIQSCSKSLELETFEGLLKLSDDSFKFCKPLFLEKQVSSIVKDFLFQLRRQDPIERLSDVLSQVKWGNRVASKTIELFEDFISYYPSWRLDNLPQESVHELYQGYQRWHSYAEGLESQEAKRAFFQNTFPLIFRMKYAEGVKDCFDDIRVLTSSHQVKFFNEIFPLLIRSGVLGKDRTASKLTNFFENFLIPVFEADTLGKGALLNASLLKYEEIFQKFSRETPNDSERAHLRTQKLFLLSGGVLLDSIVERVKFSYSQKLLSHGVNFLPPEVFDLDSLSRDTLREIILDNDPSDENLHETEDALIEAVCSLLTTRERSPEKKTSGRKCENPFTVEFSESVFFQANPWHFDGLMIPQELRSVMSGLFVKRSKLVKPKAIPIAIFDGFYKGRKLDPLRTVVAPAFECLKELTEHLDTTSEVGTKDFIRTFNAFLPSIAAVLLKNVDVDEAGDVLLKKISLTLRQYIPHMSHKLIDETIEATRIFIVTTLGVFVSPHEILHPFFRSNQELEISIECDVLSSLYDLYYQAVGINAVHERRELDEFKAQASRWSSSKNGERPEFNVSQINRWLEGIAYSQKCSEVIDDFFVKALPFWIRTSNVSSLRAQPKSKERLLRLHEEFDQWISYEYTNLLCRIFSLPERSEGGDKRLTDEERSLNGFFDDSRLKENGRQFQVLLSPADTLSRKLKSLALEIEETVRNTDEMRQNNFSRLIASSGSDNAIKSLLQVLFQSHRDKGAYIGTFVVETLATHPVENVRKADIGRTIIYDSLLNSHSPLVMLCTKAKELSSEELIHCIFGLKQYLEVTLPDELGISFESLKAEILPLEFEFFLNEADALIKKLGVQNSSHEREIVFTNVNATLMRSILSDTKLFWPHQNSFAVALIEPESLAVIGRVTGKIDKSNDISLRLKLISKVDRWVEEAEKANILRTVSDHLKECGFTGEILIEQSEENRSTPHKKTPAPSLPNPPKVTQGEALPQVQKAQSPIPDPSFRKKLGRLYGTHGDRSQETPGWTLPQRED